MDPWELNFEGVFKFVAVLWIIGIHVCVVWAWAKRDAHGRLILWLWGTMLLMQTCGSIPVGFALAALGAEPLMTYVLAVLTITVTTWMVLSRIPSAEEAEESRKRDE